MGAYGAGCNAILDRQKPALKKVQELIMRIKKEYHLQ